jgi:hypothetical protein
MVELPRVRERLVRQEEPPRQETLVGVVHGLQRDEAGPDDQETASVILVAEVRGRTRKVHMTLSGADHDWAVVAHRHKVPSTVTGMLAFERRAWRLTDVEVDSSFLRHTLARESNPSDDTEPV